MNDCKKHVIKYRVTDSLCRCEVCNKLYTSIIKTLPVTQKSQCEQQYLSNQMVAE